VVQISLKKKATGALVATGNSTDGSYIFNTLNNGKYIVTATDNSGCSASANATVSNAICPEPTGLKFTKINNKKVLYPGMESVAPLVIICSTDKNTRLLHG
jgi:hypothetical protein